VKPLRIELAAFGPYASREVIDFTEIEGASLLLIHGPTGSGKTTILDAMCYALFGDTSGAEREGKQMRCDNADPELATFVRYEFALGSRRFCVERRPEQLRPSKRGDGMTRDTHQATLWDRSAVASPEEEGKLMVSGAAKVKKAVTEIFGFESEQFRQVVMLPQGQFRKLLTAESKEKEKILQRLFQTAHYSKLERALAFRASDLKRRLDVDQKVMVALLGQEDVETIEELSARIDEARAAHKSAKSEVPSRKKKSEKAGEALSKGNKDAESLREAAEAQRAVETLAEQKEAVDGLRREHALARKAVPLTARADALSARMAELERAHEDVDSVEEQLQRASDAKDVAADALAREKARSDERDRAAQEQARLESMKASVARLEEMRAQLLAAKAEEEAQQERAQAAASDVETRQKELTEVRAAAEANTQAASRAEALELTWKQSQALFEKRDRLDLLGSECQSALENHQGAEQGLKARAEDLESREGKLALLEKNWQSGQAGALARDLVGGQACPVCGSHEHPQVAPAPESLPSESELEEGRLALREARKAHASAQEKESASRAARSSSEAKRERLAEELGESAERDLEEWKRELDRAASDVERALAAKKALAANSTRLSKAEALLGDATESSTKHAAALAELRLSRASLAGSVAELEAKVPPDLRQPGSLAAASSRVAAQIESLKQRLASAQEAASEADTGFAACEAKLKGAQSVAVSAWIRASEVLEDFEERCFEAGFEDQPSFVAAQALVPQIPDLEARIKKHDGEVKAAADRLERAAIAAKDTSPPDLEALAAVAEESKAELVVAIRAEADARNLLERLKKVHSEHEAIRKKVASEEEQWRVVASVSELANGKVPPKVSFQRFVLGALLDEVLLAATERLTRMSKGRYQLQRQSEARHKGRASGLDLEVMDTYTGAPRSVNTLSGGESFLAALALSLGLADVVQGFSGGIRLDTLLIDEGFGTLDADSLDSALDTLTELIGDGRLVGIISHVDELKTRITTRLEVHPSEEGSSTRFVGTHRQLSLPH
jgi:exonuclease SbcC